ncbi:MAG: hypothetical protein AAF741_00005 [Bacteroidota bacterium]
MKNISNIYTILLFGLVLKSTLNSQNLNLEYRECATCLQSANSNPSVSTSLYQYGNNTPYTTGDLESDFDLRRANGNSRWHKGIDLRDHGAGADMQRGDALVSPETGTIVAFPDQRYKYIVIDGANYDFGYGHIFSHNLVTNTSTWRSGNFVLKRSEPDTNGDRFICVVNLNSCIAYCEMPNKTVVIAGNPHCNDTLTTTNQVAAGAAFAPIGGSRNNQNLDFPVHLHLYKFRNPANGISNANCMDPLVDIHHPQTNFNIEITANQNIEANNFSNWNNTTLLLPGTAKNSIAFRAIMNGANQGVDASRYTNTAHNLDSIQLLIKNTNANTFSPIIGPAYRSEFLLHATQNTPLYPSDIHNHYGSQNVTGISPRAYQDNVGFRPYDNYYFADFVTRIHNNDPMDGNTTPTMYAECPLYARYSDGKNRILARAKSIQDSVFYSDTIDVYIDNFKPYIKSTVISMNNTDVYSHDWTCGTTCSGLTSTGGVIYQDSIFNPLYLANVKVTVETSEPLHNLNLEMEAVGNTLIPYSINHNSAMDTWEFYFNLQVIEEFWDYVTSSAFTSGELMKLHFSGHDYDSNGNQGQELLDLSSYYNSCSGPTCGCLVDVPYRTGITVWSDDANPIAQGIDSSHFLFLSPTCEEERAAPDPLTYEETTLHGGKSISQIEEQNMLQITCCDFYFDNPYIQVTQPTSCSATDGYLRMISPNLHGGVAPIDFWVERNGERIEPTPYGSFVDLSIGTYCWIATDASGCVAKHCEVLSYEGAPMVHGANIFDACTGTSSGSIELVMEPDWSYGEGSFTFDWSTGFSEVDDYLSIIAGLPAGEYQVTVTNNNIPECFIVESFTIGEIEISYDPITVDASLLYPCDNSSNGEISIILDGGTDPILRWDDIDFHPFDPSILERENLPAGEYCYTITDRCGQMESGCIDLESPLTVSVEAISECGGGTLIAHVEGGNPPYQYSWSYRNRSEQTLTGVPSGDYFVIVTDLNGCSVWSETEELSQPEWHYSTYSTCAGITDGSISVSINNPDNEPYEITFNGNPFYTNSPESFTIENLASGVYDISIEIGDCLTEEAVVIEEESIEEEFVEVRDDEYCVFNQVCAGNVILEESHFTPVTTPIIQAVQNPFSLCTAEQFCEGVEGPVGVITRQYRNMRVEAYRELVYAFRCAGLISDQDAINLLWGIGDTGAGSECNRIRFCPLTLSNFGNTWSIDKGASQITYNSNGCTHVDCRTIFVSDFDVCTQPHFQSTLELHGIENDGGCNQEFDIPESCEVVDMRLAQVVLWHQQLIDRYDNDGEEGNIYLESTLYEFIEEEVLNNSLAGYDRRANCAVVRFCSANFQLIRTNFEFVNCGIPLGFDCPGCPYTTDVLSCNITTIVGDTITAFCADGSSAVPIELLRTLPNDIVFREVNMQQDEIITHWSSIEDLDFDHMSFVSDDGLLSTKMFVKNTSGIRSFIDFNPSALNFGNELLNVDNIIDYAYDYDLDREIIITRASPSTVLLQITTDGLQELYELKANNSIELQLENADLGDPKFSGSSSGKVRLNGNIVSQFNGDAMFGLSLGSNDALNLDYSFKVNNSNGLEEFKPGSDGTRFGISDQTATFQFNDNSSVNVEGNKLFLLDEKEKTCTFLPTSGSIG